MDPQIDFKQSSEDYLRIEQAILYLENHYREQPSLEEVAANLGLSEYHFQKLFTRWAGVSPLQFAEVLRPQPDWTDRPWPQPSGNRVRERRRCD